MTAIPASLRDPPTLLARVGFASRGLIYLLIGGSAVRAALISDQPAQGVTGALREMVGKPLGAILVVALAVGLACFAGWLAIRGWRQAGRGGDRKRWLRSIGMLGEAALHAGFVAVVLNLAWGRPAGGDAEVQAWTAWLFAHTAGRTILGFVGGVLLAGGLGMIVWTWTVDVERGVALGPREKRLTEVISRYGLTGRGAALGLTGAYLIAAAIDADPSKAQGLGGILQSLRGTPYGWLVVLLFGSAFAAAAFFNFLEAVYRRSG